MAKKMPYDVKIRVKASGDTYDYVETEVVPRGQIWCLQIYSFENETGARSVLRSYKGSRTDPLFLQGLDQ